MTKLEISEPKIIVPENKSTSSFATTVVPYYGSRVPKQSVIETDRIIFQMMDDIQVNILTEKEEWDNIKIVPLPSTRKNVIFWKLRIVLCAIIILLLVVATVVISELTKERS